MENAIINLYVKKIKAGKMTIEEVPEKWRAIVRRILER